jgi:hypothetical protein
MGNGLSLCRWQGTTRIQNVRNNITWFGSLLPPVVNTLQKSRAGVIWIVPLLQFEIQSTLNASTGTSWLVSLFVLVATSTRLEGRYGMTHGSSLRRGIGFD